MWPSVEDLVAGTEEGSEEGSEEGPVEGLEGGISLTQASIFSVQTLSAG